MSFSDAFIDITRTVIRTVLYVLLVLVNPRFTKKYYTEYVYITS